MPVIKLEYSEEQFINLIKDLLCCPAIWSYQTRTAALELAIDANMHRVQWEIYKWLDIPERLWSNLTYTVEEKGEKKRNETSND